MKKILLLALCIFLCACSNTQKVGKPIKVKVIRLTPVSIAEDPFNPNAFAADLEQTLEGPTNMIDIFYSFPYGYLSHFTKEEREEIMQHEEAYFLVDEKNHYLSFDIPATQTDDFVFKVFIDQDENWLIAHSEHICPAHCTQYLSFYRFKEGEWIDVSASYLPQLDLAFDVEDNGKNFFYYHQISQEGAEIKIIGGSSEDKPPALPLFKWNGVSFDVSN
ncbi:hypothetical protein IPG41_02030 [Candidatus Peregrinibacteria bacterium]|nr:MAG: hypothetical protein IPG41_02030 [Candidatus Peregrinibacteria bacterium]